MGLFPFLLSSIPQRLHWSSASSMPKGLLPARVVSSSFHHVSGEQRTPLSMLLQHITCGRYECCVWCVCHGVTGSEQLPGGWVLLLSTENKMFLPPPASQKGVTVRQASCCPQKLFHVPGTIRTCQKFLIRYNRRQLLVLLQNCTDEGKQCWASVSRDRGSAGEMMPKAIFLSCRGAGSHQEVCLQKLSAGQRVGRRAFRQCRGRGYGSHGVTVSSRPRVEQAIPGSDSSTHSSPVE